MTVANAQTQMLFEANKRSVGLAYVLWFFLSVLGAHRFYVGRTGSAVGMIALGIACLVVPALVIALAIWVVVDAFLIPSMVETYNTTLVGKLTGSSAGLEA